MSAPEDRPILSLIITVYNTAYGLKVMCEETPQALRQHVEFIIVDDGSDSANADEMDRVVSIYPWTKLIRNSENLGVVDSQNIALKASKGHYVCFRGSDDYQRPEFWDAIEELRADGHTKVICGDVMKIRPGCSPVRESCGWCPEGCSVEFTAPEYAAASQEHIIWAYTAIIERDTLVAFGGMPSTLSWIGDLILTASIAFQYGLKYIAKPLVDVGVDQRSYSSVGFASEEKKLEVYRRLFEHFESVPVDTLVPFATSGWLGYFGSDLARAYLNSPQFWSSKMDQLLRRNLYYYNLEEDAQKQRSETRGIIQRKLSELSRTAQLEGHAQIAVYGTGDIGKAIASEWRISGLPEITCFIVSGCVDETQTFLGYTVKNSDALKDRSFRYIIIGSKVFQQEILKTCKQFGYADESIITLFEDYISLD